MKNIEENKDICKVYLLTNTINGKIYIGQTWLDYETRMGKYGNSPYLYAALQKYGVENFKYETLASCEDQETADHLEDYYIEQYKSRDPSIGYNLKKGGRGGKHSEESKEKISKTLREQAAQWTPEERAKHSAPISTYWEGKKRGPLSEERKQFMSEVNIERHKNTPHPMLGKHHTEEAKAQISKTLTGRVPSDSELASKKKAGLARRDLEKEQAIIKAYQDGEKISDIRDKFDVGATQIYRVLDRYNIPQDSGRNSFIGKEHSEETKKKMSEARKKSWAKRKEDKLKGG